MWFFRINPGAVGVGFMQLVIASVLVLFIYPIYAMYLTFSILLNLIKEKYNFSTKKGVIILLIFFLFAFHAFHWIERA